jgi:transcription antitermination factor NusG
VCRSKSVCGSEAFHLEGLSEPLIYIFWAFLKAKVSQTAELYPRMGPNTIGEIPGSNPMWYALYTRHQHEKIVAKALASKEYAVFLPLYTALHRWGSRTKLLSLPLLPGYVFVQGPVNRWLPILTVIGVHSVVGFGGKPAAIPRPEIEALRRLVEGPLKAEPHPFIKSGDRVRLKAGPLQGLEGVLLRKKNLCKLLLSVEMLERSVAVEVDASMVERVHVPKPGLATRWPVAHSPAY